MLERRLESGLSQHGRDDPSDDRHDAGEQHPPKLTLLAPGRAAIPGKKSRDPGEDDEVAEERTGRDERPERAERRHVDWARDISHPWELEHVGRHRLVREQSNGWQQRKSQGSYQPQAPAPNRQPAIGQEGQHRGAGEGSNDAERLRCPHRRPHPRLWPGAL